MMKTMLVLPNRLKFIYNIKGLIKCIDISIQNDIKIRSLRMHGIKEKLEEK